MNIIVRLPANRELLGALDLTYENGEVLLGPLDCLARSDSSYATACGNPSRNPLLKGGDLPTGKWLGTPKRFTPPVTESVNHSYGPYGYIALSAMEGDCLEAQANGRSGLWIHSGDLNPTYTWHGMRPTHGCLRLSNNDMFSLLRIIGENQVNVEVCDSTN